MLVALTYPYSHFTAPRLWSMRLYRNLALIFSNLPGALPNLNLLIHPRDAWNNWFMLYVSVVVLKTMINRSLFVYTRQAEKKQIPALVVSCGLSFLLVSHFAPREFLFIFSGFPPSIKIETSKFQFDLDVRASTGNSPRDWRGSLLKYSIIIIVKHYRNIFRREQLGSSWWKQLLFQFWHF